MQKLGDLIQRNAELQETRDRERAQNWIKTGLNELNVEVRGEKPLEELGAASLRHQGDIRCPVQD